MGMPNCKLETQTLRDKEFEIQDVGWLGLWNVADIVFNAYRAVRCLGSEKYSCEPWGQTQPHHLARETPCLHDVLRVVIHDGVSDVKPL